MKTLLTYTRSTFWTVGVVTALLGLITLVTVLLQPSTRRGSVVFGVCFSLLPTTVGVVTCFAARALRKQGRFAKTLVVFASLYNLLIFPLGTVAGAAGLYWCFSPKMRGVEPLSADFDFQSKRGDGTHKWIQGAASVISIVIILGSMGVTNWWGQAHGLPRVAAINGLVLVFLCDWIAAFFHELGHAVAGSLAGMKLAAFSVGPLMAQKKTGKWKFSFTMASLIGRGGSAASVPLHLRSLRRRMAVEIAAGPLASLLTAVAAAMVLSWMPGSSWVMWWKVPAVVAALSAAGVLVNLIPFGSAAGYSDGALLVQLLLGGPFADTRVALKMVGTTTATATRPRNLDAAVFARAVTASIGNPEAVCMQTIEVICAVDRGDLEFGRVCMDALLKDFPSPEKVVDPSVAVEIAFYIAYLDGNSLRAGQWLQQLESPGAKKKGRLKHDFDYWRTVATVRLAQGREAEAEDAWYRAKELANRRPEVGLYAYEKDLLNTVKEGKWLRTPEAMGSEVPLQVLDSAIMPSDMDVDAAVSAGTI